MSLTKIIKRDYSIICLTASVQLKKRMSVKQFADYLQFNMCEEKTMVFC